jgi:small nuclear ribonucleoprotein D3
MANTGLGVPVKLLHESLGHIITVELKTGQLYRGKLAEGAPQPQRRPPPADIFSAPAEDNLNISLKDITVTGRDGRVSQLDQVYIRGSMVRFFIVPDMLQNAPMQVASLFTHSPNSLPCCRFKRVGPNAMRGRGIGTARGRATIMRGMWFSCSHSKKSSLIHLFSTANGVFRVIGRSAIYFVLTLPPSSSARTWGCTDNSVAGHKTVKKRWMFWLLHIV